jgi:hypothetical protein
VVDDLDLVSRMTFHVSLDLARVISPGLVWMQPVSL